MKATTSVEVQNLVIIGGKVTVCRGHLHWIECCTDHTIIQKVTCCCKELIYFLFCPEKFSVWCIRK